MMSWSRDAATLLIEEYRKWPNLYKVKSPNYKNRNLRRTALDSIVSEIKKIKRNVTTAEVQSKFQALKQNASREYRKWLAGGKTGTGSEEMETYEPSLWYFNLISYVFDSCVPRESMDSLQLQNDSEDAINDFTPGEESSNEDQHSQDFLGEEDAMDPDATQASVSSATVEENGFLIVEPVRQPKSTHSTPVPRKRKRGDEDKLLEAVTGSLNQITAELGRQTPQPAPKRNANDSFGEYVINKMSKIDDENIKDETEEQIIIIINKALKKCREMKDK